MTGPGLATPPPRAALVSLLVGDTPVASVPVTAGGREGMLRLKLESFNPCGSIKDRTAVALFDSVTDQLDPVSGIVESTSGNLGVALAALSSAANVPFTAVVDPRTPAYAVRQLHRLGASVVVATDEDGRGGYLLSRLETVERMLAERPTLRWTNQYENPANPGAHEGGTAPELARQVPADTVVLVAVSTGGTLAGMRSYAARATKWTVVGVDVPGSYAVGHTEGPRLLSGIGSSKHSGFVAAGDGPIERVRPADAVAACVWLLEQTGIGVGASSGALVAAALRLIERDRLSDVVCVCADGAGNYLDTVYSPAWRAVHGLGAEPPAAACGPVEWSSA
ncbi:pyridoxal-phosphate dependent enzyme [Micromonospora sp. WMMD1128]|uniref:pyridoxal-phosphate dependent enzyme n=1 Tax=Micromonospora sp. WMMD1128 TaxID=3015150 RepID=UPI00248BB778|nr:pyridoxal-phosphate dependent enzyme [Micromonospora sp. WMMD1128]WBB75664.1 pyridoxal-phosphate dependent enzyme [Micromonospora sp. WMMD1128]